MRMSGSVLPPACVRGIWIPLLSEVVVKFDLEGCHMFTLVRFLISLGRLLKIFGPWHLMVGWGSGKIEDSASSSSAVGYICLFLDALVWFLA